MPSVTLRVTCGDTSFGETLGVVGEGDSFGNWIKPISLCADSFPVWSVTLEAPPAVYSYKYVILDKDRISRWEELPNASNRLLHLDAVPADDTHCRVDDGAFGEPRVDEPLLCGNQCSDAGEDRTQDPHINAPSGGDCSAATSGSHPETTESTPLLDRREATADETRTNDERWWDLRAVETYMSQELSVTSAELTTLATRLRELRELRALRGLRGLPVLRELRGVRPCNADTSKNAVAAEAKGAKFVERTSVCHRADSQQDQNTCSTSEALALARQLIEDATLSLEDVSNGLRKRSIAETEHTRTSGCRIMCMLVSVGALLALLAALFVDPSLVALPV